MKIVERQCFGFRNVVSKMFDQGGPAVDKDLEMLYAQIEEHGYTPRNYYFYALMTDFESEPWYAVNIPIVETKAQFDDPTINFSSYYFQKNLVMTRFSSDFGQNTVKAYQSISKYARQKDLSRQTPYFSVVTLDESGTVKDMTVSVGVSPQDYEQEPVRSLFKTLFGKKAQRQNEF